MTENVKAAAPKILELVKSASSILLHCHIFPDCDSIGSALAMKFALEQLGKKVTVIRGDSEIPAVFKNLPGAGEIVPKNFFEIDQAQFDLFIILDSGALDRISHVKEMVFPEGMKTINIDHHSSNTDYAREFNLVETGYPSTTLILFDLFKEWGIQLTHDISLNLFMGSYTDTGGFKFSTVKPDTFIAAAELIKNAPDFSDFIFNMENSRDFHELLFQGLALSRIETFLGNSLAVSSISSADIQKLGISEVNIGGGMMANIIKSAVGWDVGVCAVEMEPGMIKVSFRTRDAHTYDLSAITARMGGGGHKAAAGVVLKDTSLDEAKKKIVAAVGGYLQGAR